MSYTARWQRPLSASAVDQAEKYTEEGFDNFQEGRRRVRLPQGRGVIGVASVVTAILLWWWASATTIPLFLPSPLQVLEGIRELLAKGDLQEAVWASYRRVLSGWALGGLVGIPLGLLAGRAKTVHAALEPFINFFRFVPPIAFISLAIIWLGLGDSSKIALIFYASMFLVFLNVVSGARSVALEKIRAAQCMGASRTRVFMTIIVPATVPSMVTGLRVGMSNSFSAVVAAELVAANAGVGHLIFSSRLFSRTDLVFAGILALGAMGYLADLVFRLVVSKFAYRYEVPI